MFSPKAAMNPIQPKGIDGLYWDAAQFSDPDEQRAYLDQVCGDNADLRRRVEELLSAKAAASDYLESPPLPMLAPHEPPIVEVPGTVIGAYKLIEQIGEGGFGVVFMAQQMVPVRRQVALKIIKPGMDTRQVISRFDAERQALALMDHPNIAKVLDAGALGGGESTFNASAAVPHEMLAQDLHLGRPYFVMELVHGIPITEYCDQFNLTTRERLELFIAVCQAVQHAHQKGVIHRDLKPTNVLVSMQDGRPTPKIIDFGIAKAINQRLTEHSLATGFVQMIGTPLYMSPEQAELSPLGVDTRSDIYSLGVMLYELLTGSTPFEKERLQSAPFDELRRIIREDEPPCPSARLSTLAADLASTVAHSRRTEPRRLAQHLCGDLDWIVMKCLEKDRNRRYATANGLAADLGRYLSDEPVQACPPSTAYRLRKFARRNRATLLTAGMVVVTLLVATAFSMYSALRAIDAERLAQERLDAERRAHQLAEASFEKARQAVDDMYTQVAERWLAFQPQMEPVQREFLEKALAFYSESAQRTSTEPAVRWETAKAYRRVADIRHRLGQPVDAEAAFRQSVGRLRSLADEFPTEPKYRTELAEALHQLGILLGDTGRYSDALHVHRRALALNQQLVTAAPEVSDYRRDLGRAHWFVGQVLAHLHRRKQAESAFRSALELQSSLVRAFPAVPEYRRRVAQTSLGLGLVVGHMGRREEESQALNEAAAILEQLSVEFPTVPAYRNEQANAYYWMVQRLSGKDAEDCLRRALALQEQLVAEYPSVTDYRYDLFRSRRKLGSLLAATDRSEEAESAYRQAAAMAETLAADAPTVHYYRGGRALVQVALGELLTKTGREAEAQAAFEQAISLFKSLVEEFPDVWQYRPYLNQAYRQLASLLTAHGRTEEAKQAHREALRYSPQKDVPTADLVDSLRDETDIQPPKLNSQR